MRHHASVSAVEDEWTFVSAARPCAICGGHDRCRRRPDDEFACCVQVSSEWPLSAGGWVHRVGRFARVLRGSMVDLGDSARDDGALATSLAQ